MLKFLFGGKKTPEAVPETDREQFKRLTTDLNALIDTLPVKPKVTLDPATGRVTLEEPEQFADEALALPAPEAVKDKGSEAQKTAAEKIADGDKVAAAPKGEAADVAKPAPSDASVPEAR
jgi:hypothetical protein